MTPLVRWMKFNAVGVLGMGVQLAVLAVLNRWWRGHYLVASAVALEVTLLHNFAWHARFTWRDRREDGSRLRQMVKFQMSNGMVSLVGNLVLMRVLVQDARLPVVVANAVAIVACSVANYCLGDRWAFAAERRDEASRGSRLAQRLGAGPYP